MDASSTAAATSLRRRRVLSWNCGIGRNFQVRRYSLSRTHHSVPSCIVLQCSVSHWALPFVPRLDAKKLLRPALCKFVLLTNCASAGSQFRRCRFRRHPTCLPAGSAKLPTRAGRRRRSPRSPEATRRARPRASRRAPMQRAIPTGRSVSPHRFECCPLVAFAHPSRQIGSNRRVSSSQYRGATLVNIREYYTAPDGELRPGKKVGKK